MNRFSFWQRWLLSLGVIFVVAGLTVAFVSLITPIGPLNNFVNPIFWGSQPVPESVVNFQRWIYSVLMATMAGWGVFIVFVAYYPFKNREKWAWNCLMVGALVWYLPDTALSLYFGVTFNAVANTLFLVAIALPLIFTRRDFAR